MERGPRDVGGEVRPGPCEREGVRAPARAAEPCSGVGWPQKLAAWPRAKEKQEERGARSPGGDDVQGLPMAVTRGERKEECRG